jgi:hypothetical protein
VRDQPFLGPARGDVDAERVEHQLVLEVVAHRPADDPSGEGILRGAQEEKAYPVWMYLRSQTQSRLGFGRAHGVNGTGSTPTPASVITSRHEVSRAGVG